MSVAQIANSRAFLDTRKDYDRTAIQKILLAMTAISGILSLIPPMRLGASLAMRSISLLSVAASKTPEGKEGPIIKAARAGAVVLGIVGLAAATPALMVASLAIDMALQIIEGARAAHQGDWVKLAVHATVLVIDTLALAGLIVGSWQLMVSAAAVSAAAFLALSAGANATGNGDDMFAYLALMGVSLAAAITIPDQISPAKTVHIKNDDPNGKIIVMKPGGDNATVAESAPGQDVTIHDNSYVRYNVVHVSSTGDTRVENFQVPEEVSIKGIAVQDFPTLPFGGIAIKAIESNAETLKHKGTYGIVGF